MNKKSWDLDGGNNLIKKNIQAKAKAKIQTFASRDLNQQYYQSNQPIHTSTAKA